MTKKQITHLTKLNIPIKKYFGLLMYFNYRSRGWDGRYRKSIENWVKKF